FRLVYDLEIRRVYHVVFEDNIGYYQAVIYCFFTSFSFFFLRNLDMRKVMQISFYILLVGCLLSFYVNANVSSDLTRRAEGRFEGAQGMSSIDYGHYGISLALLSIVYLFGARSSARRIIYISGLAIGLFVMYLSGSRSPFLALIACS